MVAQDGTVKLGFIGTGNIASAVVEGFCTSCPPPRDGLSILVSPRNEDKARNLEARFPQVRRAGSNQEVLDQSGIVLLAVRPAAAPQILADLRFREDHTVISFIPVIPLQTLASLVMPARRVFKALPLPYAAQHLGLLPFFPPDPGIADCLRPLGEPMPVADERELHLLWAVTGLISPFYALMETIQGWCVAGGADPAISKRYTASMYAALASLAEQKTSASFKALTGEAATPGGLNEMALGMIQEGTTLPDLKRALDAILDRFGEPPVAG